MKIEFPSEEGSGDVCLGLGQEWGLTKMEAPVHSHFGPHASSKGKKGDMGQK